MKITAIRLKPKSVVLILMLVIIGVGSFLRLWHLTSLPPELHRDEAAIGFNAYLVRKTGFDEHNAGPWPLVFQSFGDYKLPGMIYLVSLSQQLIDTPILAIRLPTAIASILLIPIFYWLSLELFKRKSLALISAAVVAMSPWAIFLGRTAYEPMLGTALFWLFLCLMLTGRRSALALFISLLAFFAAIWSYNTPALLLPVVIPLVLYLYKDQYLKHKTQLFIWLFSLILLGVVTIFLQLPATTAKAGTTVFASPELQATAQQWQDALFFNAVPYRVRLLLTHPHLLATLQAAVGYFQSWDMSFLLKGSVSNPWHSLGAINIGYISIITLLMALLGVFSFMHERVKAKGHWLLLAILIITPIPSALTIDTPNINRLMLFLSVLSLWSANGWFVLYQKSFHSSFIGYVLKLLIVVELILFTVFLTRYSLLYASVLNSEWFPGFAKTIAASKKYTDYQLILWDTSSVPGHANLTGSYAEIALLSEYQPREFQNSAQWNDGTGLREAVFFSPQYLHAAPATVIEWDEVRREAGLDAQAQLIVITRNKSYASGELLETIAAQANNGTWYIRKVQLLNGYPLPSDGTPTN